MKVGILHTCFGRDVELDKTFALAAQAGAEGVEVNYLDPAEIEPADHAQTLRALADKHGLAVPSLCLSFLCRQPSLIGDEEALAPAQQHIARSLEIAAEVGAQVVLVPFFGKNTIEFENELSSAINALGDMVDAAESAGVTLGIESTLNTNQQIFLLNSLGHSQHAKVYFDTGNLQARKTDVVTSIRELGAGSIAQVHFKDVRVTGNAPPDWNIPLGAGNVDFPAVARALQAIGYDGWIVLETPPGEDALRSARKNIEFTRGLLKG